MPRGRGSRIPGTKRAGDGDRAFGVYLVALDPAVGAEIQKTRPCTVISPDDLNENLRTVIVAPMTTVTPL